MKKILQLNLIIILCLITIQSSAVVKTWSGPINGTWTSGANWTPTGVPSGSDSIIIPALSIVINSGIVDINEYLENSGQLINNGTINIGQSAPFWAIIQNKANAVITNNDTINHSSGEIISDGLLNNTFYFESVFGTIDINSTGSITNSGIFKSGSFLTLKPGCTLVNSKYLSIALTDNSGFITNNDTIINIGDLFTGPGSKILNTNSNTIINTPLSLIANFSGSITNNGNIFNQGVFNNDDSVINSSNFTNQSGGSFTNSFGAIVLNNDGGFINMQNATMTNSGTIFNQAVTINGFLNANLTNSGIFDNTTSGIVNNYASSRFHAIGAGSITNNNNEFNNISGLMDLSANFENNNNAVFSNLGGSFINTDTFNNNAGSSFINNDTVDNNIFSYFTNNGTITNMSNGNFKNNTFGKFANATLGTVSNNAGSTFTNENDGEWTNTGKFTNNAGGTILNNLNGIIINNDSIKNLGGTFTNSNTSTITNNGDILNIALGLITNNSAIANPGVIFSCGGTYAGTAPTLNAVIFCFPLAMELVDFKGQIINNTSLLSWSTLSERNSEGFEIQRSINGVDYTKIGWRTSKNNSAELNNYSFNDTDILPNQSYYYRILHFDLDGNKKYSYVINLSYTDNNPFQISIAPNPISQGRLILRLETPVSTNLNLELFDMQGKKVLQHNTQTQAGENKIELDFTNLPNGVYMAKINFDDFYSIHKIQLMD